MVSLIFGIAAAEKVDNVVFCQKRTSQNTEYLVRILIELHLLTHNAYKTIGGYSHVYLDPDSILGVAPECCHAKMLLYPFKEQLHYPSNFIEEGNFLSLKAEVVCIVDKTSIQVFRNVDYPSDCNRVILMVPLSGKSNCLVSQHAQTLIRLFVRALNAELWLFLLYYNKEGIDAFNLEKSFQIPISPIKYVAGICFIFNHIHCVDIMDIGISDIEKYWNKRDYIYLRVNLDAALCASEFSSVVELDAQVYGSGIKGIERTTPLKRGVGISTDGTCPIHHIVCKVLKNMVISELVGSRNHYEAWSAVTESKPLALVGVDMNHVAELTETSATIKLAIHDHEQVVPWGDTPASYAIIIFRCNMVELPFRQECNYLTKNKSACWVHSVGIECDYKDNPFKRGTDFLTEFYLIFRLIHQKLTNFEIQ